VVKVGSSVLTHDSGKINLHRMESLVREISDLRNSGKQVILVTSGAVATGRGRLNIPVNSGLISEKQALAAIGQGILMHTYEKLFGEYGLVVAQVLLAKEDYEDQLRRENASNTLRQLLDWDVLPIVNENDTVAAEEIRFGDNDTLSALVARLVQADLLVILSDIRGLYRKPPSEGEEPEVISHVPKVMPWVEALAGGARANDRRGGMITKILAAKIVNAEGIPLVVASGHEAGVTHRILKGFPEGTLFGVVGKEINVS